MKATSLRILSGFLLLFSGSVAAFIGSILFGSVSIPLEEVFNILLNGESSRVSWKMILWDYRIPKALTAFIGGSALAVSGLLMQTYFRNPLAGPYVLGISSGASLGVAISVMLLVRLNINSSPFQSVSSLFSACLGSLLVTAIILLIARKVNSPTILLLVGLMFGYASAGVVNLLIYLSEAREIQSFMIW